jgi:hypothetical protein
MSGKKVAGVMGGLLAGLLLGWGVGWLWPPTSLHAVATDRVDTFIMATGALDMEVEAVFCLDCLTGDLTAGVLARRPGMPGAFYRHNVLKDLQVDPTRNPKFLMVTGVCNMQRAGMGRIQPGTSVVYVAEVVSGLVAAYAVPWDRAAWNAGQPIGGTLQLLGVMPIRKATPPPPPS